MRTMFWTILIVDLLTLAVVIMLWLEQGGGGLL